MAGNVARRSDGRWRARYRDVQHKEHSRHFTTKRDALVWLEEVAVATRAGAYVDPRSSRIATGEWVALWLTSKVDLKETTARNYDGIVRNHILPVWGSVRLADVTHQGVADWVAALSAKGLAGSTVRQAHRVLSLALSAAIRDGRLVRNPAERVPLPRVARGRQVYLTHGEVDLVARCAGEYRLVVLFLAYTGVRYGEMAALKVGSLDLVRRRADIREAVADVNGRAVFSTPKNHQRRTVPVPRFLVEDLAEHVAGCDPEAFVFAAPKGGVLHLRNFRRAGFDPAVRAAGMAWLTPHGLRHTAASLAIASGANVKVVQQMLGHKSATMTLDLYGHLFADQLDEVADDGLGSGKCGLFADQRPRASAGGRFKLC